MKAYKVTLEAAPFASDVYGEPRMVIFSVTRVVIGVDLATAALEAMHAVQSDPSLSSWSYSQDPEQNTLAITSIVEIPRSEMGKQQHGLASLLTDDAVN